MVHISDIKKFIHCERMYFFDKNTTSDFKPYLRSDESLNELLIQYLCKDEPCFVGVVNDTYDRFIQNKDNYEWFAHARFVEDDLRINIPFIHKIDKQYDIYDLYFVYYGTTIKDLDTITYSISLNVFRQLGYEVNNIYLISLNDEYVRGEQLDVDSLFVITNAYKDKEILKHIEKQNFDYKKIIKQIQNTDINDYKAKKCKYCKLNGICAYYDQCFPNEEKLPDNSVLTLVSSQYKNLMYENGIKYLQDVDLSQLEGNRVQYAQIMADRNNGLFIDKLALRNFLNTIEDRPISFIDFEWDSFLIPPYENMKPLDVLCFEYALYYIDENGSMQHCTYVGTGDCRKQFIEDLMAHLPSSGPILAYNAEGAEKLRLLQLGKMYPEYELWLKGVVDRFVDLATPFIEGMVYHTKMQGNFTLKKLVDICSNYSYDDLDIYDGMAAVYNWRNIDKNNSDDSNKIIDNLKQYCSLDAYGLFLVYKWLIELEISS